MKNDLIEDLKDSQEIEKQKEEQKERKQPKEDMATWEFGKGVNKKKVNESGLRG